MDLFENQLSVNSTHIPLPERLRPKDFSEFVGQSRLVQAQSSVIRQLLDQGVVSSLILWGPPGTGKTTFAKILSRKVNSEFVEINATDTGAKRLREIGLESHHRLLLHQKPTLVFIDEIHRLNKSQQDVLLPFMEKGDLVLVGATTENPSYELNPALLSRCRVMVFERLSEEDLKSLLDRAARELKLALSEILQPEAATHLASTANGDARTLLSLFEHIWQLKNAPNPHSPEFPLSLEAVQKIFEAFPLYYDKHGEEHHNCISAFIKSVRGSDPDAGLYYLARMLESGEDPTFIARRLVILASEDVGNADPKALPLAVAAMQAVEMIGLPEARINLAQVTTYLASAPKSNRAYEGINKAQELVKKTGNLPVPMSLRSAQTQLSKSLGHGKGYLYSHDSQKGFRNQKFLPESIQGTKFYEPSDHGFEKTIKQYLEWLKN